MSKELLQKYERLYAGVKEIVNEWDPIGVLSSGEWPDEEYDSYIPSICSILMNASEVTTLESKLNAIVELNIGLGEQRVRNKLFAKRLWELREEHHLKPKQ